MATALRKILRGEARARSFRARPHTVPGNRQSDLPATGQPQHPAAASGSGYVSTGYSRREPTTCMNPYLSQIEGAVEAVEIHSPTTYSWFGKRSPQLPTLIRRSLTPSAARSYLRYN